MSSPIQPSPSSSSHPHPHAHPLRPYYQPSSEHASRWLSPPPASKSHSPSSLHLAMAHPHGAPSKPPSDILRAAPAPPAFLADYDIEMPHRAGAADSADMLRGWLNAGLMAFTSTAMVMPFEVGKTLLQVQWVPREEPQQPDERLPVDVLDEEDEDDLGAYFTETRSTGRPSLGALSGRRSVSGTAPATAAVRARPEYVLPLTVQGGVTEMMRGVCRWRGEGVLALWKGQLTTCLLDGLSTTVQPALLALLALRAPSPAGPPLALEHHAYPAVPLALAVGSYVATGLLLAPLDLVRTRLIVQSSQLRHRAYTGPLDGLQKLVSAAGGLGRVYGASRLLLPALLDNLLRPLVHLASPLLIDRLLHLDRAQDPLRYGLAELALSSAALLFILPLETVRKRLQIQPISPADEESFKPCVSIRPKPYAGIVEACYRIVTEEKAGVAGLYKGFKVGLLANVVVFVLGLVGKPYEQGGGWAEV